MSRKSRTPFIAAMMISIMISFVVGILVKNFTEWSPEVIFVCSLIGSYFSYEIIRQIRLIISSISGIVKDKFGQKTDNSEENEIHQEEQHQEDI